MTLPRITIPLIVAVALMVSATGAGGQPAIWFEMGSKAFDLSRGVEQFAYSHEEPLLGKPDLTLPTKWT